jgi:hypothetical protein
MESYGVQLSLRGHGHSIASIASIALKLFAPVAGPKYRPS